MTLNTTNMCCKVLKRLFTGERRMSDSPKDSDLPDDPEHWDDMPIDLPVEALEHIRTADSRYRVERLRQEVVEVQRRLDLVIQLLGDGTAFYDDDSMLSDQ